jgi:hypothetical protein
MQVRILLSILSGTAADSVGRLPDESVICNADMAHGPEILKGLQSSSPALTRQRLRRETAPINSPTLKGLNHLRRPRSNPFRVDGFGGWFT